MVSGQIVTDVRSQETIPAEPHGGRTAAPPFPQTAAECHPTKGRKSFPDLGPCRHLWACGHHSSDCRDERCVDQGFRNFAWQLVQV